MKKLRVYMEERVFYQLTIEVADDAIEEDIYVAAEEAFVQGSYQECGQDDRRVTDWEDAE